MYTFRQPSKEKEFYHHDMKQTGWTLDNGKRLNPEEMYQIMEKYKNLIETGRYQQARGIENMRQYPESWLTSILNYIIERKPKNISDKLKIEFSNRGFLSKEEKAKLFYNS